MLLAEVIARCSDEAVAEEVLLSIGDLATLASLREQSAATGVGMSACLAAAARGYASEAPEEEWITLMGLMNGGKDPGAVFLKRALAYARRHAVKDGCGYVGDA